jgi:hypothetical protein
MNEYLQATGDDWIEYDEDEKKEVIAAIYDILKLPETASEAIGLKALNNFYAQLADDHKETPTLHFEQIMNTLCMKIITTIIKSVVEKETENKT